MIFRSVQYGIYKITDGTTTVNLMTKKTGIHIEDSTYELPEVKQKGVWVDSDFTDGRYPVMRVLSNPISTLELIITAETQDDIIDYMQNLIYILDKAVKYWTIPGPDPILSPVYIMTRGMYETGFRYATIYDYRIPEIPNPYAPPFGTNYHPYTKITLVLEHSLWWNAAPGSDFSIPLSNAEIYQLSDALSGGIFSFSPGAANQDAEFDNTVAGTDLVCTVARIGSEAGHSFDYAVLFPNVTLNPAHTIISARITLVAGMSTWGDRGDYFVRGELNLNPGVFVNYANYIARPTTIEEAAPPTIPAYWVQAQEYVYNTEDVRAILREIIDQAGWASGNNVAFFFQDDGSAHNKRDKPATWDHLVYNAPVLDVVMVSPENIGIPATTEKDRVFLANCFAKTQIVAVHNYDQSMGTYANLVGTPLPWTLFPNPVGVGDCVFFGIADLTTLAADYVGIYNLIFNLTTPQNSLTIVWEYYDPIMVGWIAIASFVDYTASFSVTGMQAFIQQSVNNDYGWQVINGINAHYIRARVTAVGGGPVNPVQGTYPIWRASCNYLELSTTDTSGEHSPQCLMAINPISGDSTITQLGLDQLWVGRRTVSRGSKFRSCLPCSGGFGAYIECFYESGNGLLVWTDNVVAIRAIYGRSVNNYTTMFGAVGATAETMALEFVLTGDTPSHFVGQYRVFLRRIAINTPENGSYRLAVSSQRGTLSSDYDITEVIADTANPGVSLIDFGIINLPTKKKTALGRVPKEISIQIFMQSSAAIWVHFTDLILIPADEWIANVYQLLDTTISKVNGYRGLEYVIDGLQNDKEIIAYMRDGDDIVGDLVIDKSSNEMILHKTQQRFHFLFGNTTGSSVDYQRFYDEERLCAITMELRKRFLTLRGAA